MDTISDLYESRADLPKYRAVAQAVETAVRQGRMTPGDRLPPVRDLAWRLGITPGTVARAYTILTDQGLAVAEVGRGTFIADPAIKPRALLPDPPWSVEATETEMRISLAAPKLPDCGQVQLVRDAFARLAEHPAQRLLNYPSRSAFRPAREAALTWLSDTPMGAVEQEDLILSHGGQNGIGLVMQAVLRGPRPVVLVEDLSYPGFRRAADLLRAVVVPVPMDEHGLIPEALDAIAARHDAQLLCTSPEVHNPTSIVTPAYRREAIAEVARRRGFHVLEDDCYRIGARVGIGYRALLPEQGWLVASFSKAITPALRIGFVVAPQGARADLRRVAEHGFFGLAQPLADLAADVLSRPDLPRVLAAVREEYTRYVRVAVNQLGGHDLRWREDVPFLWLTLPAGWRAAQFVRAAEAAGVQLRAADDFAPRDGNAPHAVRIAVNAQVPLAAFEDAVGRIRALLENPPEGIAV
ncbi:PLP-dependent aminotransferase family protein [Thetidibacter halocola]|uniref:PLP-dependent aminotransferase family protein n=1 Tax=Thetidibacter halocola TaxID=2827239 RepID=A0A8J8B6W2_9RHOB|nr:PLP-dependent aminotransferase family protein [Thetidibacter halocola]MBS0122955.1 PLP-dependent aminotransferase family protein [Thetidibacter halocola]